MKIPRRDPSGAGLSLWRRSARMASVVDLVRPKADFDPETIAVLCAALDEAWDRLLQSGSECTRPAYARAMREVVARCIIDMAQRGIRDQKELANGALRFLAANYRLERRRWQGSAGTAVAPAAPPEITAAGSDTARRCRNNRLVYWK
jgi:hypothetical protein